MNRWLSHITTSAFFFGLLGSAGCGSSIPEDCVNEIDDDQNGATDCQDDQCVGSEECAEVCSDGEDNDLDGDTDCFDPDCVSNPLCAPSVEICNDSRDNDLDGATDCDDTDCGFAASCEAETECFNGVDDNLNGATDCADPDCSIPCTPENCSNNIDDNQNGLTDCQETTCAGSAGCFPPEAACTDGVDEDQDGLTDCADPDCSSQTICIPESCIDGIDNNQNGQTDCADAACSADPNCCNPNNDQCLGNNICIVDACLGAFGRSYRLSNISVELTGDDGSGSSWDSFGGDPDIKVTATFNGSDLFTTSEAGDTLSASYNNTANITINASDSLNFRVFDVDALDPDDTILTCSLSPISVDLLRFRDLQCNNNVIGTLSFRLSPN